MRNRPADPSISGRALAAVDGQARPRHRPDGAPRSVWARIARGSPAFSNGRSASARHPLGQHLEIGAQPQRTRPRRAICARVSRSMNAPPPVASTCTGLASSRAMTRRSPSRNTCSPRLAKISSIVSPAAASISSVRIQKRQAEPQGETAPDLGLARTHQPDQDDRPGRDKAPHRQGSQFCIERVSVHRIHSVGAAFFLPARTVLAYPAAGSSIGGGRQCGAGSAGPSGRERSATNMRAAGWES